ncbi:MAG: molybdenum cofactor biosynthesis protein MoaE [Candidatus Marinimicrobia bacterium]|nr:molybdenum cofactor biosynthesis protein MoaE [Candidatus Neomarinimicrobiota bacterium]
MVEIVITSKTIIPENKNFQTNKEIGSKLSFSGCVREKESEDLIKGLDYEYYKEMAEKELLKLGKETKRKFNLISFLCIHRIGFVPVGDVVVHVEITSSHRTESLEAMSWFMIKLKEDIPIWKNVILNN